MVIMIITGSGIATVEQLSIAPHLHRLSRNCFYQMHQLRTVACSLSTDAATTLMHYLYIQLFCITFCMTGLPWQYSTPCL